MNSFELIGTVGFGKGKSKKDCIFEGTKKDGKGEYKILSFSLYSPTIGYLECKTFDWVIIENIKEGDRLELTRYIPKQRSWTNQVSGEKCYKTELVVEQVKFLGNKVEDVKSSNNGWVDASNDHETITKEEVDKMFESEEIKDIEKTLDDINKETTTDSVDLDEVFKGL